MMGSGASSGLGAALNVGSSDDVKAAIDGLSDEARKKLTAAVEASQGGSSGRMLDASDQLQLHDFIRTKVVPAINGTTKPSADLIETERTTGFGGSLILRVQASGITFALHLIHPRFMTHPGYAGKFSALAPVLHSAGLFPKVLATGSGWYAEAWGGISVQGNEERVKPEGLGRFLFKLHSTDTAWFQETRRILCESFPDALDKDVSESSVVWCSFCHPMWCELFSHPLASTKAGSASLRRWASIFPPFKMAAFNKGVTAHCDINTNNLILTEAGELNAIDLESATVTSAVAEFMRLRNGSFKNDDLYTKTVIRAYLECSSKEGVDEAAVLDAWDDIQSACVHFDRLNCPATYAIVHMMKAPGEEDEVFSQLEEHMKDQQDAGKKAKLMALGPVAKAAYLETNEKFTGNTMFDVL